MAGLIHNYVGLADRTVMPVGNKPKARRKQDWAWKPYRHVPAGNGSIRIYSIGVKSVDGIVREVGRLVSTVVPGKPKREARD